MYQVAAYVNDELWEHVLKLADKEGDSASKVVRDAIEAHLKRKKKL